MKKKDKTKTLLFIALSICLWVLYGYALQCSHYVVHEILQSGTNKSQWSQWIYDFYPRLQTEKWRFDEQFFFTKSQQLLFRNTWVVQLLLLISVYWYRLKKTLTTVYKKTFNVTTPSQIIQKYVTPLLYLCLATVVYDAIVEFQDLMYFKAFYSPIGIGKLLLPVFPSLTFLWLLYLVLLSSILAILFLPYKWISATISLVAFIYYQLLFSGFNKYDHGYTTITYAMMVYPFILFEQEKNTSKHTPAWGIVLIQVLISLSYFYGGLEKMLISGWDWVATDNLQQHLLMHQTHWGVYLASFPTVCKGLSFGVILFQCSFILLPFFQKLRYILLPVGFIFHTATWLLLDAGGLINPWWCLYLFFLIPLQAQETK